ncbi:unnamed protein product (macronuclear) [Paramecium tetraurelia]|uniref:PIR Superfamily Protein n=1 Tax=Paramecium tetraurelia TaxID=5888 RepID=A0DV51_PARTE|nr:uncharacterized protein GSPATT00020581001 [Paramecium tetraurelia]CAK86918.1 unnamed protein product [Paramecium tetraurelia]|eukprot:XP_001454315.1 hypothetical protein (macronuclear) [Paramecium tetraurelia strain d4-2]
MSNNDLCETIVNHANRIYQSLANLNPLQNENGDITNPSMTSTGPSIQGLTTILVLLMLTYAFLSFISPRKQILSEKEQYNRQQQSQR